MAIRKKNKGKQVHWDMLTPNERKTIIQNHIQTLPRGAAMLQWARMDKWSQDEIEKLAQKIGVRIAP